MKMAKVSPAYEGKLGKRDRAGVAEVEEELGRSRRARIDAKARRWNSRMNCRALLFHSSGNTILTGSSSTNSTSSSLEKEIVDRQMDYRHMYNASKNNKENDRKAGTPTEVIIIEDDKNDITQGVINIVTAVEKELKFETETAAAAVAPAVERWQNGWFVGCEDWPMMWTYEEECLWWRKATLGLGFGDSNSINPQWEYKSGVGWIQMKGE